MKCLEVFLHICSIPFLAQSGVTSQDRACWEFEPIHDCGIQDSPINFDDVFLIEAYVGKYLKEKC